MSLRLQHPVPGCIYSVAAKEMVLSLHIQRLDGLKCTAQPDHDVQFLGLCKDKTWHAETRQPFETTGKTANFSTINWIPANGINTPGHFADSDAAA